MRGVIIKENSFIGRKIDCVTIITRDKILNTSHRKGKIE